MKFTRSILYTAILSLSLPMIVPVKAQETNKPELGAKEFVTYVVPGVATKYLGKTFFGLAILGNAYSPSKTPVDPDNYGLSNNKKTRRAAVDKFVESLPKDSPLRNKELKENLDKNIDGLSTMLATVTVAGIGTLICPPAAIAVAVAVPVIQICTAGGLSNQENQETK